MGHARGRPSEDQLGRRIEIFQAVGPLITSGGGRRLTMAQAAHAACLSIGGLYHYFPGKRDLLLFAVREEPRARLCHDWQEAHNALVETDATSYLEAYVDFSVHMIGFVRPSIMAALELGAEDALLSFPIGCSRTPMPVLSEM